MRMVTIGDTTWFIVNFLQWQTPPAKWCLQTLMAMFMGGGIAPSHNRNASASKSQSSTSSELNQLRQHSSGGPGPPLWKNMISSIGMMQFPIYGKIAHVNQTTNQVFVGLHCLRPTLTRQAPFLWVHATFTARQRLGFQLRQEPVQGFGLRRWCQQGF